MWNLSYRWQRQTRVAVGVMVLASAIAAAIFVSQSAAARRTWSGVRELAGELADEDRVDVSVPARLQTRVGTLVYGDREDGLAVIVGRVVRVQSVDRDHARLTIQLMGPVAEQARLGGVLRGAKAPLDLREAMRLLVSPNTFEDEAIRARDTIWPSVTRNVLPAMADNLIREIAQEVTTLDARDEALLANSFQQLRDELQPLEDELVDRLARRAWNVVGVSGLAGGLWNSTAGKVQSQGALAAKWWWELFGSESKIQPPAPRFLSEETQAQLEKALKDEALAFWREHRTAIVAAVTRVVEARRPDFEQAFKERWAGKLFERAVVPAWQAGESQVLESVQVYANDFASRRLLTKAGGPRLLFAYALRSSLDISDDPLLIFSPESDGKPGIDYEPLVR